MKVIQVNKPGWFIAQFDKPLQTIDCGFTMKMFGRLPPQRLHRLLGVGPLQHQASPVEMGAVAEGSEGFL